MAVLVRWRTIEGNQPAPAGDFGSHALAGGRVPAFLHRSFGVYCVDTAAHEFAITYDDGPATTTNGVLDVLQAHDAVATFFVLAQAATAHPEIVRRIVAEGHELALHGRDHRSLLTLGPAQAKRAIQESRIAVEQIAGRPVRLYRPPYGQHTAAQARMIRRLGLILVIWSGDAHDWVDAPASHVAFRALSKIFPGSIQLMHDTRADPETLEAGERLPTFDRSEVLEAILSRTDEEGYRAMTVSDLIARHPVVQSMNRERMSTR